MDGPAVAESWHRALIAVAAHRLHVEDRLGAVGAALGEARACPGCLSRGATWGRGCTGIPRSARSGTSTCSISAEELPRAQAPSAPPAGAAWPRAPDGALPPRRGLRLAGAGLRRPAPGGPRPALGDRARGHGGRAARRRRARSDPRLLRPPAPLRPCLAGGRGPLWLNPPPRPLLCLVGPGAPRRGRAGDRGRGRQPRRRPGTSSSRPASPRPGSRSSGPRSRTGRSRTGCSPAFVRWSASPPAREKPWA